MKGEKEMIWIQKDREDNYRVYVTVHNRMMCVNELDKTAYHVFLEYMKQMSFSSRLPFQYIFPTYSPMPEIRFTIVKKTSGYYIAALNLGSVLLSEMDQIEFDYLIEQLDTLPSSNIGRQIYFPLVKDIFKNDK